jgi:hypothetical protein
MSDFRFGGMDGKGASIMGNLSPRFIWLTPQICINAIREVMGEIDLDAATNIRAQERIKAKHFFTYLNSGLTQPWHGRVFLNPNHGPVLQEFAEKMKLELLSGRVTELIFLTHTRETWKTWFQEVGYIADAVCFHSGEIDWVGDHTGYIETSEGQKDVNLSDYGIELEEKYDVFGSVFFYFGKNVEKFKKVFSKFGFCK